MNAIVARRPDDARAPRAGFHAAREILSSLIRRAATVPALSLALAAGGCGGGGGGGGPSLPLSPPEDAILVPTPARASSNAPPPTANVQTYRAAREYQRQMYAMERIGAAEAYATFQHRRAMFAGEEGGDGITVAVIDGRVNARDDMFSVTGHDDFAGRTDVFVVDARGGVEVADEPSPHATVIAGVIAAQRGNYDTVNDRGMHGVAYNANILSYALPCVIGAQRNTPCTPGLQSLFGFLLTRPSDYPAAAAISVNGAPVRVVNASLGSDTDTSGLVNELVRATQAQSGGVILVFPTGNEGAQQPIFPARHAANLSLGGRVLAVTSIERSPEYNWCGDAQQQCLAAPAINTYSTTWSTVAPDDSPYQGNWRGTSFAAPYVAGAAAVLLAAFPGMSAEAIVRRMLDTADDLGTEGVDARYGHGRLNLAQAILPQGTMSLHAGDVLGTASVPFAPSTFAPGAPFAGLSAHPLWRRALVFDRDGFPFRAAAFINTRAPPVFEAHALLNWSGWRAERNLGRSAPCRGGLRLALSQGTARMEALPLSPAAASLTAPFAGLAGAGEGVAFACRLNPALALKGALHAATGARTASRIARIGATFFIAGAAGAPERPPSVLPAVGALTADALAFGRARQQGRRTSRPLGQIGVHVGALSERGRLLGGMFDGVFADAGARGWLAGAEFALNVTGILRLFGAYHAGVVNLQGGRGLVASWERAVLESFYGGVSVAAAGEAARLSFTVGQPLRARSAALTIDAAVARSYDGVLTRERGRVSLKPRGREWFMEGRLSLGVAVGHSFDVVVIGRVNPGHDVDAGMDIISALTWRATF